MDEKQMGTARYQPRHVAYATSSDGMGHAAHVTAHGAAHALVRKRRDAAAGRRCGGRGEPLVLLHPFALCSEVWRPVLPALTRQHEVFALSIPGHHGSDPLPEDYRHSIESTVDLLEAKLDALGLSRAHLVGNSLGGWLAIELARRGRALSVVALAPGGGWEPDSREHKRLVRRFQFVRKVLQLGGPVVLELARFSLGRSVFLRDAVACPERLTHHEAKLIIERTRGCAIYDEAVRQLLSQALPQPFERLPCPVRLVWGADDRLLPLRGYSERYQRILPGAEWVVLSGVGHVQMYDDPHAVAGSILGFTRRQSAQQLLAS